MHAPFLILALSRSMHARASSSGLCPPGPRSWIVRPSHLRVSHASPGLRGRPRGWWNSSAVSMQRGCASCRACRSDSSEWPKSIVEGSISVRRYVCTSASVVVTGSSASAVIPEKLGLRLSARNTEQRANSPGEIVSDRAGRLDKLIICHLS